MDTSSVNTIVSFATVRPAAPEAAPRMDTARPIPDSKPAEGVTDKAESAQVNTSEANAPEMDLDTAVRQMNDFVQVINRNLQFSVDDNSGRTIVTVVDADSQEIIRQIPPEKLLDLAQSMGSEIRGLLLQAEV